VAGICPQDRDVLIGIDASRATVARRTGTENYALRLIQALLGLGAGHRLRLYTNRLPAAGLWGMDLASAGATMRYMPFPRLWTHLRLSAEMLASPPDVLFVPSHVLPLVHPRRSVVTVHDLGYLYYPEAHRSGDRRYLHWSTGWSARHATALLADSQATRADLERAYGIDPARVTVVYLGRDERLERAGDPQEVARAGGRYGVRPRYLLYVGTLQPRKNLERVIAAFARLAGDPALEDVTLVLAGRQGWLCEPLFRQVEQLGLAGRVFIPGYIADEDLAGLYSGALAYVFPSLHEGFGFPVLEAQACGVPVMTSNNSSLPEVAGDAALLVDPHDVDAIAAAMYRLVTDEALRRELVRRGYENVKRFSWEKCARETLAVLESVVDK
jgi:glycosyltransferase involved in cell wall biosynthesis